MNFLLNNLIGRGGGYEFNHEKGRKAVFEKKSPPHQPNASQAPHETQSRHPFSNGQIFLSALEFFLVAPRFHSETVNITLVALRRMEE